MLVLDIADQLLLEVVSHRSNIPHLVRRVSGQLGFIRRVCILTCFIAQIWHCVEKMPARRHPVNFTRGIFGGRRASGGFLTWVIQKLRDWISAKMGIQPAYDTVVWWGYQAHLPTIWDGFAWKSGKCHHMGIYDPLVGWHVEDIGVLTVFPYPLSKIVWNWSFIGTETGLTPPKWHPQLFAYLSLVTRPGKRLHKTMENHQDPPFLMGKSTISMAPVALPKHCPILVPYDR